MPHVCGAIINAVCRSSSTARRNRISARAGSVLNLFEERYGHHPAIYGGVLSDDCADALRAFFGGLRG